MLWEEWIDGFAEAMALRPDAWQALANGAEADALARLTDLVAVARGESDLDTPAVNALDATAPAAIADAVQRLYAARGGLAATAPAPAPAKVGRNDPCRCGSGKKSKKCCG